MDEHMDEQAEPRCRICGRENHGADGLCSVCLAVREEEEAQRGMPFEEAIGLSWAIMHTPGWRVDGLQDRAFYPGNWRVHAIYQPRKPNGLPDGSRAAKWVWSPDDWQAWRLRAMELNTRNARAAQAPQHFYALLWTHRYGELAQTTHLPIGTVYRFKKRHERDWWVGAGPMGRQSECYREALKPAQARAYIEQGVMVCDAAYDRETHVLIEQHQPSHTGRR